MTFHTDNGREFSAKKVLDMVREWNPNCTTVTGRVRTPRDQGSVENANKMIKRIISSLTAAKRQEGESENWVLQLGRAMASINSYEPSGQNSTNPYLHVFSMLFDSPSTMPIEIVKNASTESDS